MADTYRERLVTNKYIDKTDMNILCSYIAELKLQGTPMQNGKSEKQKKKKSGSLFVSGKNWKKHFAKHSTFLQDETSSVVTDIGNF